MLFINRSCEPNVGFAGNVVLLAMRDVEPGDELTTDYALFDTSEASWIVVAVRPLVGKSSAAPTGSCRSYKRGMRATSPGICSAASRGRCSELTTPHRRGQETY